MYPFSAVVGQEGPKRALLLNLVDPSLGGVLLCGQKGTSKSTLARSVKQLCPTLPFVELPLNVTEDRLLGGIDLSKAVSQGAICQGTIPQGAICQGTVSQGTVSQGAIRQGTVSQGTIPQGAIRQGTVSQGTDCQEAVHQASARQGSSLQGTLCPQTGLLAQSHGGILHVDEINLLPPPIATLLLDAAESGVLTVEREGISQRVSTRFILLGSMNPDEGGLSPQLLDRFAFCVPVVSIEDLALRVEIIQRLLAFEQSPRLFCQGYQQEEDALRHRIATAKQRLRSIALDTDAIQFAAHLAAEAHCQGNRAELVLCKAARAWAAWKGDASAEKRHVAEIAALVLAHRMRNRAEERSIGAEAEATAIDSGTSDTASQNAAEVTTTSVGTELPQAVDACSEKLFEERLDAPGETFDVGHWLQGSVRSHKAAGIGRRSGTVSSSTTGRTVRTRPGTPRAAHDLALEATLRAAVIRSACQSRSACQNASAAPASHDLAITVKPEDLRLKVRQRRSGRHILFVVDASGSMGADGRMRAVKGAVLSLLGDAYRKRDQVGLIAFRKERAELLLNFTRSVELAESRLTELSTGGKTPLAEGLHVALRTIANERIRSGDIAPVAVLLSDGRATWAEQADPLSAALQAAQHFARKAIPAIVVDTEEGVVRLGLASHLAQTLQADLLSIEDLKAETLSTLVREVNLDRHKGINLDEHNEVSLEGRKGVNK